MPTLTPQQFADHVRNRHQEQRAAIKRGIVRGVEKGVVYMKKVSPVDMGELRDSWTGLHFQNSSVLINAAPHAGVMERGARPHAVNREGMERLMAWCERHGMDKSVAWAIAKKLEKEGYTGTFFVKRALSELAGLLQLETEAELRAYFEKVA